MALVLVDTEVLVDIADAIRAKSGESGTLTFPDDFIEAIEGLLDTSDATATADDILDGMTAYVDGEKVTGNIESIRPVIRGASAQDMTITKKYVVSMLIRGVKTDNISAENIKAGVNVKVGDVGDMGRLKDVTGTFTSDANAAAGDVLSGKTAYVNGSKITGTMENKEAETFNTSGSDRTIASGKYLSGVQTIKGVKTNNIDAANIKAGITVKVGDANDAGRIKNVTGTFTSDATATAADIASGKTAYVNGVKITGTRT